MKLTVAAAQSASAAGDVIGNVANHLRFCRVAAERGAQLLVFPELSLVSYELSIAREHALSPEDPRLSPLRDFAVRSGMTIVAGAPVFGSERQLYIGAFVFRPEGAVGVHTKVHVHSSEMPPFAPGSGGAVFCAGGASVGLAICADLGFPEHAAKAAAAGASVYAAGVMLTADGYQRKLPLLERYSREHRMAVLLANYSGVTGEGESAGRSALWAEDGTLVAACEARGEALLSGTKQSGRWSATALEV